MNDIYELHEDIKKHLVNIFYNSTSNQVGSGVIINCGQKDSNIRGIITVKHLFEKSSNKNHEEENQVENKSKFKKIDIDINNITIRTDKLDYIYLATNSIFLCENFDIAILLIKNNTYIDNLPTLKIYNQEILPTDTIYAVGFPNHTEQNNGRRICKIYDGLLAFNPKFELHLRYNNGPIIGYKGGNQDKIYGIVDFIEGMSGGGLFLRKENRYYLIGIQKQAILTDTLVATDLHGIYEILGEMIEYINNFSITDKLINLEYESEIYLLNESLNFEDFNCIINHLLKETGSPQQKYKNESEIDAINENYMAKIKAWDLTVNSIITEYLSIVAYYRDKSNYRKVTYFLKKILKIKPDYESIIIKEKLSRNSNKIENQIKLINIEKEKLLTSKGIEKLKCLEEIINLTKKAPNYSKEDLLYYTVQVIRVFFCELDINKRNTISIKINNYEKDALDLINKIYDKPEFIEEKTFKLAELYYDLENYIKAYKQFYILHEFLKKTDNMESEKYLIVDQKITEIVQNGYLNISAKELIELYGQAQPQIDELLRITGKNKIWSLKQDLKKLTLENQKLHEELQQYKHN